MIIAVPTTGNNLDSLVDSRFGRTRGLIFYNTDNGEYDFIENSQIDDLPQGAGVQTSKLVIEKKADVLISGHIGPNAYKVLAMSNIEIFSKGYGTVKEAIEDYKNHKLSKLENADKPGHWM
ncbi:MAG: NifB/NifX family molybdenum-iron cluster-binding protein [Candidatus Muiribacteriota bacterium]